MAQRWNAQLVRVFTKLPAYPLIGAVAALALAQPAHAHPTSYQGAISIMGWNQPWLADYWNTYSLEYDLAIAARYMRMDMPEGRLHYYLPQVNYLLKRWNATRSQANIYLYGGYGALRGMRSSDGAWSAGAEADAESRSLFGMLKAETLIPGSGSSMEVYAGRVGVAPYESAFDELGAWLMLQYQYHPRLVEKDAITPLARFYYRNVLWEIGMSLKGDTMLNLMFHF